VQVLSAVCDVRKPADVKSLFAIARARFHRLDILINNAGVAHPDLPLTKLPFDTWREVIDTNLNGMFLVTQNALPLMKRGSTIVNNLSVASRKVFPGSSAYDASKHGALGLSKSMREELRPQGIRVIALLPGAVDTDIWNSFWPDAPRKKMMSADSVARIVINALMLPQGTAVEELIISPVAGSL
jgi:NAD(P)-dependent dehydrogenase (short-subunit alcohol dehydrogenase family)